MRQPSDADIEIAREYLRQRLDAESSMTYNLESVMREAAQRIVDICYKANISPTAFSFTNLPLRAQWDINAVVEWLQGTIEDYCTTLAVADHEENRDRILPFILGENHGMTFEERLSGYCGKYRDELMLLIGAGLFLGVGEAALVRSIGEHLRHPYNNQLLADGINAPLSYGRGRTNSMFTAIGSLTGFGVGRGWMYHRHLEGLKKEATGFVTFRNSSYPCDICDDYANRFHPIDDEIPPLHLNCVCGTIYVNYMGEPLNF